jgi:peptidoglycan/LPS O-acetylase OafA/YrhL
VLVQLYLIWPLLLCALRPRQPRFRARVAACVAALGAAGVAWRFWAAWHTDFHMPAGDRNLPHEEANMHRIFDALYLPTLSRLHQLALGASLGLLLRSRPALSWVMSR